MSAYITRRIFTSLVTLFLILTITFIMFRLLPGDPTIALTSPLLPAKARQDLQAQFGLDKSVFQQYYLFIFNTLKGNFGHSFFNNVPVFEYIMPRLLNTLFLSFSAFFISYSVGLIGGLILIWKYNTWVEKTGIAVVLCLRAPPVFWTGMLAMMFFSFQLGWFPYRGIRSIGYTATGLLDKYLSLDFLHHLVLPSLVMSAYLIGFPMLLFRNSLLRVMKLDYVQTARAKGLSELKVLIKHTARNGLLPIVTAAGTYIGLAAGGMAVVEFVFSWPGLGQALIQAIGVRDYPIAQGAFFLIGAMVIVANFIVDLIYVVLDPRITYD
ncbi:MAG: ABC transporter permease [Candidatus Bipolaricaulia bacterium]